MTDFFITLFHTVSFFFSRRYNEDPKQIKVYSCNLFILEALSTLCAFGRYQNDARDAQGSKRIFVYTRRDFAAKNKPIIELLIFFNKDF